MTRPLALRSAAVAVLAGTATTALFLALGSQPGARPVAASSAPQPAAAAKLAQAQLAFEPNAGRFDRRLRYLARGPGYTVFLTPGESVTSLSGKHPAVLRTRLLGASGTAQPRAESKLQGIVNSFVGPRSRWRSNIPTYGRVVYSGVYPGIDLAYHGRRGALEYDFELAPGADPDRIGLALSRSGALRIDRHGDLVMRVAGGIVRQQQPVAYQVRDGARRRIAASWRINGGRVGFRLGRYDHQRALVIDPVLMWTSYYGGSNDEDNPSDIALDSAGNIYATGGTQSSNFRTSPGVFQPATGGPGDAFILKLAPDGTRLYATYLGGADVDGAGGIAADSSGNAYVAGLTVNSGLEVPASNPDYAGGLDGFVAKISPTGSQLLFFRYFGGALDDRLSDIKVVGSSLYVAGTTSSTGLQSSASVAQPSLGGGNDAIVAKLASDGSVQLRTYLGGTGDEFETGLQVDGAGNVFVSGYTSAPNAFPLTNASQSTWYGDQDGFLTKFNTTLGAPKLFSTIFGGGGLDTITSLALTPAGKAYVAGSTTSYYGNAALPGTLANIHASAPTPGGVQSDAFLARFSATGSREVVQTFGGGDDKAEGSADEVRDLATDAQANIYVVGDTESNDFDPLSEHPLRGKPLQGTSDGFAAKITFDAPGSGGSMNYAWATYFGGNGIDSADAVAVDASAGTYMAGSTTSSDLPKTAGTAQPAWAGATDGWFARLAMSPAPAVSGPSSATTATTAEFLWDTVAEEPNMLFKCSFDGEPLAYCTSPASRSGLGDGTHTFTREAYDLGLTPNGSITRTWQVDTSTPDAFDLDQPADGAGGLGQHPDFSWQAANDGTTGVQTYRLIVDGTVDREVTASTACADGICRTPSDHSLAEGTHTWKVAAVDGVGHTRDSSSTRSFSVAATPVPTLTITPNPALVGRVVNLQATSGLDDALVKSSYAWDLDGNGNFETDTGATATTATIYSVPATVIVAVRVTTPGGTAGIASAKLQITAIPGSAPQFGVSINNGAQYTNSPDVTVTTVFPTGTSGLLFSNDGGFFNPAQFKAQRETDWKLDSSGPERLPKTVYVRFLNGPIASNNFTDDIILDETPPKVQQASVAAAAGAASIASLKKYKLKIKATDSNSGVGKVQVTANKKKPGKLIAYKRKLTLKLAARPKYVRARDRAGNFSRWRKMR